MKKQRAQNAILVTKLFKNPSDLTKAHLYI